MPRPRTLSEHIEAVERSSSNLPRAKTFGDPPPGVRRLWGVIPLAVIALLLGARAYFHVPPLDRLAPVAAEPGDPTGSSPRAGSLAVPRGGSLIIGFVSPGDARLVFSGQELRGRGLVTRRIFVVHGPTALRFAGPPGARLVWSPPGRRGEPEYVSASSLSPQPPAAATFSAPGTARLDGAIALACLLTAVAALCMLARRRLAAVSRDTWLAMGAVFVIALAARLAGLGDAGQTWDEAVYWASGRNHITDLLALDFSDSAWAWNYEHPPVTKLLAGIGAQWSDGFGPARVLSALWLSLGCALLVPIGARLYRLRVGILAAAIAALLPPLVAHGQIVGHESPTVLWWSLGILLALGVHDYLPSSDRRALTTLRLRLLALGAVIGIAVASRFINGLLGPLCALIVVVQTPPRWRTATFGWGAALVPLAALATFIAVWPRLWTNPFAALAASFEKLDVTHAPEPFLGAITSSPGPHYFAIYLFATLPAGILAGVVAWLIRLAREAVLASRDREAASHHPASAVRDPAPAARRVAATAREPRTLRSSVLVAAWLVLPLLAILSPVRQDGVRYVMPALPALAMMAAAGFDWLALLLERRWAGRPLAFLALATLTSLYLTFTIIRSAPYHLDYFGEHTGGAGSVARHRWLETAWWGEGLDRAIAYVNAHAAPSAAVHRDCIAPSHLGWFREDLWPSLTTDPSRATWLVVYSPATRSCRLPPDARLVYSVTHDGATLAAVYQRP